MVLFPSHIRLIYVIRVRKKMTGRYQAKISKFDIVAAIDIGTSSSGYAYSSVTEFDRSPLNIISEQCCNKYGMCKDDTERKTASYILLDKDENFVSFGYDAQHIFADYQSKKKDGNFALFQHFKMNLYEQKVCIIEQIEFTFLFHET